MTTAFAGRRLGRYAYVGFCAFAFVFLLAPILVIVPLSFNAEPYFTFTEGMLRLDADAWSLRWYRSIVEDEQWGRALVNSMVIGIAATLLATTLGTVAALGLANPAMPGRRAAMGILISPMITPVVHADRVRGRRDVAAAGDRLLRHGTTEAYMRTTRAHFAAHDRPVACYTR